jgi:lysophospholipase L1-like esterase
MKILFIGDSLIEYFDWAARFRLHGVFNLGIGGETVEGLYRRLDRVFRTVAAADMIFLMSGINNLSMGDAAFIGTYGKIIDAFAARYPSAKIIIHS